MTKKYFFYFISILFFLSLTGCKINFSNKKNDEFFLKITDSYNREIILNKKPKRIISLAPNITELIYTLNAENILIGRTDYCDYPEECKKISSVGSIMSPNIEKIIELKPDLIIASTHFQKETLSILEKLGINVYIGVATESYEDIYKLIKAIGRIGGKEKNADKLIDNMKNKIEYIKNKVKNLKKPDVYYMLSFGESGDFTAGKDTFISYLINTAGGNNIADEITGWKYSVERIIEKNPDIIICNKFNNIANQLKIMSVYNQLKSVKNNKIYPIDINLIERIGPRNIKGLFILTKIFHPEINIEYYE